MGGIALDAVMEKRLEQIYKEEENLKEIANVCQSIRQQNLSMEEIGEQILEGKERAWREQLERIWREDITKEPANLGQLNRNMAAMLSWGYLIKSGKNQEEINQTIGGIHLAFFYLALMGYVLLIFLLSKKWENFFAKARNILVTGVIYTAVMTVASGGFAGVWLQSAVAFLIFTFYIGLGWFHAYHDVTETNLNRYYVVVRASRIMNIGGVVMHLRGLAVPTTVYR